MSNEDAISRGAKEPRKAATGREEMLAKKRRTRVPLGKLSRTLEARLPKGYSSRWVNDTDSRIMERLAAGWRFVVDGADSREGELSVVEENADLGTVVSKVVGENIRAYLMVIEEELYEEDVAENRAKLDAVQEQIDRGLFKRGDAGGEVEDPSRIKREVIKGSLE